MSRIINTFKFYGEFELALCDYKETENQGIFKELISYTAALENVLKDHLENSTIFKTNF